MPVDFGVCLNGRAKTGQSRTGRVQGTLPASCLSTQIPFPSFNKRDPLFFPQPPKKKQTWRGHLLLQPPTITSSSSGGLMRPIHDAACGRGPWDQLAVGAGWRWLLLAGIMLPRLHWKRTALMRQRRRMFRGVGGCYSVNTPLPQVSSCVHANVHLLICIAVKNCLPRNVGNWR